MCVVVMMGGRCMGVIKGVYNTLIHGSVLDMDRY